MSKKRKPAAPAEVPSVPAATPAIVNRNGASFTLVYGSAVARLEIDCDGRLTIRPGTNGTDTALQLVSCEPERASDYARVLDAAVRIAKDFGQLPH